MDRLLRRLLGVLVFLFGAWNEVDLNCGGKAQLGLLGALGSGWVLVELLPAAARREKQGSDPAGVRPQQFG